MTALEAQVKELVEAFSTSTHTSQQHTNTEVDFPVVVPLTTVEDVRKIEEWIKSDSTNGDKLVSLTMKNKEAVGRHPHAFHCCST